MSGQDTAPGTSLGRSDIGEQQAVSTTVNNISYHFGRAKKKCVRHVVVTKLSFFSYLFIYLFIKYLYLQLTNPHNNTMKSISLTLFLCLIDQYSKKLVNLCIVTQIISVEYRN